MKLSKRSLIKGGWLLIVLLALFGIVFWAQRSGKLSSLEEDALDSWKIIAHFRL